MRLLTSCLLAVFVAVAAPSATFSQNQHTTIACDQTYTVVSGDNLTRISLRAYGQRAVAALHSANAQVIGADPNLILVGQRLQIPCQLGGTPVQARADLPAAEPQPIPVSDTAAPETLVLTFNKTSAPPFIINSGIIDLYLAEITEVTDGRVRFVDPPQINRNPEIQLDLVAAGEVDGAYVFNGYLLASHPLLQLPMLPLMGGSAEQTAVSLWRLHETYLAQTDYFDEAELMGFIAAPAAHIWRLNGAPVLPGSDILNQNTYDIPYFEGLDTRGPAAVQQETALRLANYNEATNGSLTFFMAHGAARAAGVWANDRTVTEIDNGVYTPTFSVILSNQAWARISPQDQAAIREISGERLAERSASWDAFDNGHRAHMLTTGLNVAKADAALLAELEAELASRLQIWIDAATLIGVPGAEAISAYRQDLASLQDRLVFR